eukprot:CAMPEP_0173113310 /NCGR_PEP_ID=MMETSP1102-20130122/46760_1 /TAXON_ID=49646 /ORGANISM="Geminigera sp., Strain Caron Lab Isolate" /LENGTH=270 /DNA_ID=CAMNT_0014014993 /DNA_START=1 /DNA_END=813 /DNA_ORIENTATION=+
MRSAVFCLVVVCWAVGSSDALAPVSGNLALRGGGYNRKTFGLGSCLQDHVDVMKSIPKILDGYVGPNKIDPKISESCMLAVNSVNSCAFCTSLHGELGRMAGLENKGESINTATDAAALKKVSSDPMVVYARKFGECNGRGADLKKAFDVMEKAVGPGKAAACEAQCWFLHWGSTCGNTLLSFFKGRLVGNSKCGSNPLFELVFAIYYTPCYLAISATSLLLKAFPAKVPKFVSYGLGCVLTTVASIWVIPLGVLGLVTSPFRKDIIAIK